MTTHSRRHRRRPAWTALLALGATIVGASTVPSPGGATPDRAAATGDRTEVVLEANDDGVRVSEVTWKYPLPAGSPSHPAACDTVSFIRYKLASGPSDPSAADAVVSVVPGAIGGASSFDPLGRNVVRMLAESGKAVEFWAVDRRANCLEDKTGVLAAIEAEDASIAFDYYYKGATVNGKRFGGFLDNDDLRITAELGLERTVLDWHFINSHEIPNQALRKQKLFVGGHSLGGAHATGYLGWDFDGNHATTADAGYNQAAGYVALDTITGNPIDLEALPLVAPALELVGGRAKWYLDSLIRLGVLPRTMLNDVGPVDTSNVFTFLNIAAMAARFDPDGESELIHQIPRDLLWEGARRLIFSQDYAHFLTGVPDIRNLRMTNEAFLGMLNDDNSFYGLQASYGTYDGGPTTEMTFPLPSIVNEDPLFELLWGVASPRPRIQPTDYNRLYTWRNYDEVDEPFEFPQLTRDGRPVTSPDQEVTDAAEYARGVGAGRLDFTEHYFPLRQATDVVYMFLGVRSGDLKNLRYANEVADRVPGVTLLSRDLFADHVELLDLLPDQVIEYLSDQVPGEFIIQEGYSHIDTITAAAEQNNGLPESSTKAINDLILDTI